MKNQIFSVIRYDVRALLDISVAEYCLCELIHNLAYNPSNGSRWCYAKQEFLGDKIGISKRAIIDMETRLTEQGILEKGPILNGKTRCIRTTVLWDKMHFEPSENTYAETSPVKKLHRSSSEETSSVPVKKLHTIYKEEKKSKVSLSEDKLVPVEKAVTNLEVLPPDSLAVSPAQEENNEPAKPPKKKTRKQKTENKKKEAARLPNDNITWVKEIRAFFEELDPGLYWDATHAGMAKKLGNIISWRIKAKKKEVTSEAITAWLKGITENMSEWDRGLFSLKYLISNIDSIVNKANANLMAKMQLAMEEAKKPVFQRNLTNEELLIPGARLGHDNSHLFNV